MGGAVCTRACPDLQKAGYVIGGITVLDVVEGTALEALPHMMNILNARPDGFPSVEKAVEWQCVSCIRLSSTDRLTSTTSVTTNTIRNTASARVSIPAIVKPSASVAAPHAFEWRTPLRSTAPYWTSTFSFR
jgi:protein phosphatase methylesterase 1